MNAARNKGMRLAILCNESYGATDGIRDYSVRLSEAIRQESGLDVDLHMRTASGQWIRSDHAAAPHGVSGRRRLESGLNDYDAVVLQYNPFMYGRWGFAPWLPIALWRLRRIAPRPTIGLMVHEKFVQMTNLRRVIMGLWQRLQLLVLRVSADVVFVSIQAWTDDLREGWPEKPTRHLPVASSLPDMRSFRAQERHRVGATEETIVLVTLGNDHPTRLPSYMVSAANTVAASGRKVIFMNLGATAPRLVGLDPRIVLDAPGELSAKLLSRRLAAGDIFLAPFVDGVSTRRTTLMAALQNGVAVVGTVGRWTDSVLKNSDTALRLTPVSRPDLFSQAVMSLASDRHERVARGEAGRTLYANSFDWPMLARRVVAELKLGDRVPNSGGTDPYGDEAPERACQER